MLPPDPPMLQIGVSDVQELALENYLLRRDLMLARQALTELQAQPDRAAAPGPAPVADNGKTD